MYSIRRHEDGTHVEIHVLPLDEEQTAVIALAGAVEHEQPDRVRLQGPFPGRETARGVCNGVLGALEERGYATVNEPARWQLVAWRERKRLLDDRAGNRPDSTFHPDDVLFWPR